MIHFDFTVTDEDAEAIFNCIESEICSLKTQILSGVDTLQEQQINKHINHLAGLKDKMNNSVVMNDSLYTEDDIDGMVQGISDMLMDLSDEQVIAMYRAMLRFENH